MPRETNSITTANGHVVEHYSYLTGKEARQIQEVFASHVEIHADQIGSRSGTIKGDVILKSQDKALEILVVSVDGKKENPVRILEDLPAADYADVVKAFNKIVEHAIGEDFLGKPSTPASA